MKILSTPPAWRVPCPGSSSASRLGWSCDVRAFVRLVDVPYEVPMIVALIVYLLNRNATPVKP